MELSEDRRTATITSAAQEALEQWMRRIGDAGTVAMRALPGLLAAVDQHAAEVRDTLTDRRGRLHPMHLAAYADGVADAATARGWSQEEIMSGDWSRASWPSLRLLAICVLVRRP